MDNEITRLIMALLLTGIILFAWNYYRAALNKPADGTVSAVEQPKKVETEKSEIRKNLSEYENCGYLKVLVYPLHRLFEYGYRKTGNLGAALVLITLLIRIILTPLSLKQIKSAKKMAGLKAVIEKIKAQHKDSPMEMQRAIGKMFKEKGVNPFGNIGWALIQIPLFFALYKIVRESQIFSGAKLGLWINDLGAADPFFILPVAAGLVMLLGSWTAADTGTHTPKCMMYIFPAVFTSFLLNQPSGLALYMLIGSACQLAVNIFAGSSKFVRSA